MGEPKVQRKADRAASGIIVLRPPPPPCSSERASARASAGDNTSAELTATPGGSARTTRPGKKVHSACGRPSGSRLPLTKALSQSVTRSGSASTASGEKESRRGPAIRSAYRTFWHLRMPASQLSDSADYFMYWHICATTCSNGRDPKMPRQPHWFQQVAPGFRRAPRLPCPRYRPRRLGKTAPRFPPDRDPFAACLRRFPGRPDVPHRPRRTHCGARAGLVTANPFSTSSGRRMRLGEELGKDQTGLAGEAGEAPGCERRAAGFPALGMRIVRAGVLEVEFASAEDLLGTLYEFVRMAGDDLEVFEAVLSGTEEAK